MSSSAFFFSFVSSLSSLSSLRLRSMLAAGSRGKDARRRAGVIDNNGNTLTDASGRSFTWDFDNRLIQAIVPGTSLG